MGSRRSWHSLRREAKAEASREEGRRRGSSRDRI